MNATSTSNKPAGRAAAVLMALRANAEGSTITDNAGQTFKQVYLDNARLSLGMKPRTFAGYLSTLQRTGHYRTQGDDCFGDVLMA